MSDLDRLPPHDLEAEAALLGSLLLDRETILAVADWVSPEAFYHQANGIIYRAVKGLYQVRKPADLVTLSNFLASRKLLEEVGGVGYLSSLMTATPTAVHAEYYAEIVMGLARRRALIEEGAKLVGLGYAGEVPLDDALGMLRRVEERFPHRPSGEARSLADEVELLREQALGRWEGTLQETIIPTGIAPLDRRMLDGMRPGELIYVGGRPGSGKTSIGLQIARHVAGWGKAVCFAELEMERSMLLSRLIAHEGEVPFAVPFSRIGDTRQRDQWLMASEKIEGLPLLIDEKKRTTDQLASWVAKTQAAQEVGLLVVDHLDLLSDPDLASQNAEQRTAKTSQRLKRLGMDLGIPVLVLAQLNRSVEAHEPYIPDMSHIRYSGSAEQDADWIWLLYRRMYYVGKGKLDPDPNLDYLTGSSKHRVEFIVAKARNGETGTIELGWTPERMHFSEAA